MCVHGLIMLSVEQVVTGTISRWHLITMSEAGRFCTVPKGKLVICIMRLISNIFFSSLWCLLLYRGHSLSPPTDFRYSGHAGLEINNKKNNCTNLLVWNAVYNTQWKHGESEVRQSAPWSLRECFKSLHRPPCKSLALKDWARRGVLFSAPVSLEKR